MKRYIITIVLPFLASYIAIAAYRAGYETYVIGSLAAGTTYLMFKADE
jgi:hypothetical protein